MSNSIDTPYIELLKQFTKSCSTCPFHKKDTCLLLAFMPESLFDRVCSNPMIKPERYTKAVGKQYSR